MSRQIDWQKTVPIWEANPKIVAAWVFGSAQDGTVREGGGCGYGRSHQHPSHL